MRPGRRDGGPAGGTAGRTARGIAGPTANRRRTDGGRCSDGGCAPGTRGGAGLGRFGPVKSPHAKPAPATTRGVGRIPIVNVSPTTEEGRWPAKAVVGEAVPIRATVFREGHDAVGATAVLIGPDGKDVASARMVDIRPGLDVFEARLVPTAEGRWSFRVEGWSDPYGTWSHDASIKVPAEIDVELMLAEGAVVLTRAAGRPGPARGRRRDPARTPSRRSGTSPGPRRRGSRPRTPTRCVAVLAAAPAARLRDDVGHLPARRRPAARDDRRLVRVLPAVRGRDLRPRGQAVALRHAAHGRPSGSRRSPAMGFDVVYLIPIHPIGTTFRKGRNNSLTPVDGDPGSPYAIGSPDGGHDAIHPELGHVRGLRRVRRGGPGARPRGRTRPGPAVLARPPVGRRAPGVVHHARRRLDRVRREPAEEVPGHLPAELRQRPGRHLRRGPPGDPGRGSTTASRSSASTTRTRSRSTSGSGCSPTSRRTTRTSSSCPRRSPGRP